MPLVIFIYSILFLKGYSIGTALAIVGILNFIFAIIRNSVEEFRNLKEKRD